MPLSTGSRLGPYEVLGALGSGGMGEVYRARDTRLEREVAIKVLPAELASDAERLKRFEKEARSASALNHPNIVTIYDIGSEGGVSYIAMERVEGTTLREQLLGGPLPTRKLLQIAPQIAEGLSKAHEAGIVHRDLKPENVMVTKDGLVKILDFGLAKLTSTLSGSGEGSQLPTMTGTTPGVVVGTVGYMSPEQASGEVLDFRSDQFALGSILYEMATGKRAFQKKTAIDTLAAILNEDPPPIGSVNPQVPAPLRWIVERCLAKDPEQRYASTKDLARELATLRDHLSEASVSGQAITTRRSRIGSLLVPAASLVLIAIAWIAGTHLAKSRATPLPKFQQLTFQRGAIYGARFSRDGQTVLYGLASANAPPELFSTRIGSSEYRMLGLPSADILAVSSKDEVALLLGRGRPGMLARAPLAGRSPGGPRRREYGGLEPERSRARSRALGRREAEAGVPDRQGALRNAGPSLGTPRVPEGRFHRRRRRRKCPGDWNGWPEAGGAWRGAGSGGLPGWWIRLVPFGRGDLRVWQSFPVIDGCLGGDTRWPGSSDGSPPWSLRASRCVRRWPSPDGTGLVHTGTDRPRFGAVEGAKPGLLARPPLPGRCLRGWEGRALQRGRLDLHSRHGWVAGQASGRGACPRPLAGREVGARISSGIAHGSVSLANRGRRAKEDLDRPDPSSTQQRRHVFLRRKAHPARGTEAGHGNRLYVLDLTGGAPRPVTLEGVGLTDGVHTLSPDGKFVAAGGPDDRAWFYPLDGALGSEARPIPGLSPGEFPIRWSSDGKSLFFWGFALDVRSGRRRPWKEFRPPDPAVERLDGVIPARMADPTSIPTSAISRSSFWSRG